MFEYSFKTRNAVKVDELLWYDLVDHASLLTNMMFDKTL